MFKNLRIGTKLGIGFSVVTLLLVAVASLGLRDMAHIKSDLDKIANDRYPNTVNTNTILDNTNKIIRNLRLMPALRMDQRQTVADEVRGWSEANAAQLDEMESRVVTDNGTRILGEIREASTRFDQQIDVFLALAMQEGNEAAVIDHLTGGLRQAFNSFAGSIEEMLTHQDNLLREDQAEAEASYSQAQTVMLALTVAAALIASVLAWFITRGITGPVSEARDVMNRLSEGDLTTKVTVDRKDEVGQLKASMQVMVDKLSHIISEVNSAGDALASASEEVSATAQNLSQGSTEQASSVEETTSSIEQMSASINQNTENAKATDGMSSKAATEAQEGGEAVNETVDAMKSIAEKISIIDDIAYQTNLLALNAAIEAARAGEHGKGFAVVAAEVRKLAERSQVAAQEIGEVAKNSVDLAERAGTLLNEMVPSIQKTSDLVQEISAASEEQNSAASQINSAMEQLNSITQQSASSSEELAATSEEMSGRAENLQQLMAFFKTNDQQATGGAPRTQGNGSQPAAGTHRGNGSDHGHAHGHHGSGGQQPYAQAPAGHSGTNGQAYPQAAASGDESEFVRF
jgi:methyl-accepting chemotaxis protein